MIVALCGCDGVGKTSLGSAVAVWLGSKKIRVKYLHITRGSLALFVLPWIVLFAKRWKGVVICDRSYYDTLVNLFWHWPKNIQYRKRLLILAAKLLPAFDLTCILHASFEQLNTRTNELSYLEYVNKVLLYDSLLKLGNRKKMVLIPTDIPESISFAYLAKHLKTRLSEARG